MQWSKNRIDPVAACLEVPQDFERHRNGRGSAAGVALYDFVRFEVLTVVKMTMFWVVTPRGLVVANVSEKLTVSIFSPSSRLRCRVNS
jgi:hypothetical protein